MRERFHSSYFETDPKSGEADVDGLRGYLGEKLRAAADAADVKRMLAESDDEKLSGEIAVVLPGEIVTRFRELFRMCLTLPQIETLMDHVDRYVASVDWAIDELNGREEDKDNDAEDMIALVASIGVADNVKELLLEAMAKKCSDLRKECADRDADCTEGDDEEDDEEESPWKESLGEIGWKPDDDGEEREGSTFPKGPVALDANEMDPEDETMLLAEVETEPVDMQAVLESYLELQESLDEEVDDREMNDDNPMYNQVVQDVMIVVTRLCRGQINLEVLKALWQDKAVQEQLSFLDAGARYACYRTVFHDVAQAALMLNDRFNMAYGADGEDGDGDTGSSSAVDGLIAKLLRRR